MIQFIFIFGMGSISIFMLRFDGKSVRREIWITIDSFIIWRLVVKI